MYPMLFTAYFVPWHLLIDINHIEGGESGVQSPRGSFCHEN